MAINPLLEKELAQNYVYDAWQFVVNTHNTIGIARYCADLIQILIERTITEHTGWRNDLFNSAFAEENKGRRIYISPNSLPGYELNILGIETTYPFMLDKNIKDCFQYIRNSFDCMSQIINSAVLANRGKKRDVVDFPKIVSVFDKQTYSSDFPVIQQWLNDVYTHDCYKYIDAFNNRTKHTCDVRVDLALSFLDDTNTFRLGEFYKREQQPEKDIAGIINEMLAFTEKCFEDLLVLISSEIKRKLCVSGRFHQLLCYQQKFKDDPNSELSVVFIEVTNDCSELPDTLRILLLNDTGDAIWSKNCEIKNIFIRNKKEEYIGRYVYLGTNKRDTLLEYTEYARDSSAPFYGWPEVWQAFNENKTYYKSNPYISLTTVSDDDDFLRRTQLPF